MFDTQFVISRLLFFFSCCSKSRECTVYLVKSQRAGRRAGEVVDPPSVFEAMK